MSTVNYLLTRPMGITKLRMTPVYSERMWKNLVLLRLRSLTLGVLVSFTMKVRYEECFSLLPNQNPTKPEPHLAHAQIGFQCNNSMKTSRECWTNLKSCYKRQLYNCQLKNRPCFFATSQGRTLLHLFFPTIVLVSRWHRH